MQYRKCHAKDMFFYFVPTELQELRDKILFYKDFTMMWLYLAPLGA